jgi:cell wall-associated NlpC family hydrolase
MTQQEQRQALIAEAESWLGTRFHCQARVKIDAATGDRGGVDCATFLIEAYRRAGVVTRPVATPNYKQDWHLHTTDETYVSIIQQFARQVEVPQPGDIALFRFRGRVNVYAHAGIILEWPTKLIHAGWKSGVQIVDTERDALFANAEVRFFSPWTGAQVIDDGSIDQQPEELL